MKNITATHVIIAAFLTLLMAAIFNHIAVTADAYVTFRVVDNFVHGYGLRWNIIDRVQVYTHPLWMFLHIPFYALGINIFYVTVALSAACTLAAAVLAIYTFQKPWPQTVALFLLPLTVSQSFIFSSINGLENPLSHLLFACFAFVLLRPNAKYFWFWISLSCALSLMNRLDTVMLFAPVIGYLVVAQFRSLKIAQCMLGALPFIGWECFSLFYYGFLLPNTAYAKLDGVTNADAIRQGLHYFLNLLALDITSAEFLFVACLLPLYRQFAPGGKTIRPEMVFLALGILLYALYVIDTGGTYLSGRFWSLPIFASLWLIYGVAGDYVSKWFCLWLALALVAIKLVYPGPMTWKDVCPACFTGGIWPSYYSVFPRGYDFNQPDHTVIHRPLPVVDRNAEPSVAIATGAGIFGFESGPRVIWVNPMAFTDPLLARLPNTGIPLSHSINNHWLRAIPKGYIEAVKTGSLDQMDPALAEYYGKLRLIIAGDLWSWQRIQEIFRFNRGDYDYLLVRYDQSKKTK